MKKFEVKPWFSWSLKCFEKKWPYVTNISKKEWKFKGCEKTLRQFYPISEVTKNLEDKNNFLKFISKILKN